MRLFVKTIALFLSFFALACDGSSSRGSSEPECGNAWNDWPRVVLGILGEDGTEAGERYNVYGVYAGSTEHVSGTLHGCPSLPPFLICSYSWTPGASVEETTLYIENKEESALILDTVVPVPGIGTNELVYLDVSLAGGVPTVKDAVQLSVCDLDDHEDR
ncbi:MAG: hypothetical protein V3W44_05645 [Dehalococcoidales bacterium]